MKFFPVMRNELFVPLTAAVGVVRSGLAITARTAALMLFLLSSTNQPALAQSQTVVIDCLPPWQTNDRFLQSTRIKHPSLSLNGFDCGSNCAIGYGLKQVLEKVYGANQDDEVKAVFRNMIAFANRTFEDADSGDNIGRNTQILQAKGFVALAAYVLENNDYDPTILTPTLPSAAQAVDSFRRALLNTTKWKMDEDIEDDGIKWATPVTNVARAMDFYLALENAYEHYEIVEFDNERSATILSSFEKNDLTNEYARLILGLNNTADEFLNLISRYRIEAGNAPLKIQVAAGYASLTWQSPIRTHANLEELALTMHTINGFIPRSFKAAGEHILNNRRNYWRYQSDNGKNFWAEGAYYFHLTLSDIIPFWHSARINGLLGPTSFDFADPFRQTWFLNPLHWLADISTPDGKTPPLDDGHKRSMYNASSLRWTSDYGDDTIGEKFARVYGAIEAAGEFSLSASLYPVVIAIPRRSVSDSTLSDGIVGNPVNQKTMGEEGHQELVVRRTIDGRQHYLFLNGESGDAIQRGEGHEQADQMQLLYYVDDISYLVDSGYDRPRFQFPNWYHSTWNNYSDHNVMTMKPGTSGFSNNDGGINAPVLSGLHVGSNHQGVHEIYYQVYGQIDLLSASITLKGLDTNAYFTATKMADYYRNVLFIRDATHPYIVDINAVSRIDEFTHWYNMLYHGNSNTVVDRLYYNKPAARKWINIHTSEESSSPTHIRNRSLFIQPFAVERRLVSSIQSDEIRETRISEERGTGIDIKKLLIRGNEPNNDSSKEHFTTVAFIHVLFDEEGIGFIKENKPLLNTSGDRDWQYYTWSPRDEVSPGEPDSTIVDVVVARSAAQYVDSATSSSPVKLHFSIAEADSFYMELSSGKNYGFARLRKQGQTWSIDPDFQINLEKSVPHAGLSGPTCIHEGENGHFTAGASGGRPPYTYAWSYYQVCRTRDIPCDRWSTAGSGQAIDFGANNWDRFRLRVQATDNSRPSQSVYSSELDVKVRSPSAGPCPSPSDPPDPQGKAESDINVPETSALEAEGIEEVIPETYALRQNFPNPFNPSTEILFDLPEDAMVLLVVYDVLGREVARLVQEELPAGTHRARFDAGNFPSGVYFYRIQAGDFHSTHRMTLLK